MAGLVLMSAFDPKRTFKFSRVTICWILDGWIAMRTSVAIALLLSGCSLAQVNQPASSGHALVRVAHTPAGEPAVILRAIHSRHGIRSQEIGQGAEQMALRPGTYVADLECGKPGGRLYLHAFPTFRFSVQADMTYIIDCLPNDDDDGFVLREPSNQSNR